ncbi:MAG: matrixin family metalloprotease, partial [Caulobacteraceae bacterium]
MVEKTSVSYAAGGEKLTRSGYGWSNTESQPVTYGFRTTWLGAMPEDTASFSAFNAVQVAATKLALLAWSDVANITFTQGTVSSTSSSTNPSILFGNYGSGADGAAAFAYLGGNRAGGSASGDVWVNGTLSYNQNPELLRYGVQVLVHEIGHALGLEHPADYDASSTTAPTYAADATFREDTRQYTVMS